MKKHVISLTAALASVSISFAQQDVPQTEWTLRQCIDYAAEHNNTIRQRMIERDQCENTLSTQRGQHLPSVSAYVGQNFDFGRGLTVNNTYENKNTRNTSMGILANMTLFEGFQTVNSVKVSQLNLDAAIANLDAAREDLGINVAQAYLQVLCAKELAASAHEQVSLSQVQLDHKEALLKNGKASEADVYAARSLVAQDNMNAVKADNDYYLALLDLSQLLELPSPDGLSVAMPDTSMSATVVAGPEAIYQEALAAKASIRAAQVKSESAERQIAVAKGAYSPTLSLSAGVSTGYYAVSGQEGDSFGSQLDQNLDKSISLSLSIPIFNRFASRNNIRAAKMSYSSSLVDLDDARKSLYKEIQQAYYNAVAAQATYASSQAAAESAEAAYRLAEGKYSSGLSSATDYAEARTNRLTALASMIQYKYEMIFRGKILDFYRGAELN